MNRTLAVFVLSLAALSPAPAHDLESTEGPQLLVNVWVRNSGGVDVWTIRPAAIDEDSATDALRRSLGCELAEPGGDSNDDQAELWGECVEAFDRSELLVQGAVDLGPLEHLAAEAEVPFLLNIGHSSVAHSKTTEAMGRFHTDWGHGYYNADFSQSAPPERVPLAFGYREADLVWALAAAILAIFGPLPVVTWLRGGPFGASKPDMGVRGSASGCP